MTATTSPCLARAPDCTLYVGYDDGTLGFKATVMSFK